jgi:vitamin B12 transporter
VGLENVSVSRATADIAGAYAQLMMEPLDGLTLTGGARIDDHDAFGKFHTHRLTGAYLVPGTETKLRATLGTGFRAPSLDELYGDYGDWGFGPFQYGNPNLQPEESTSWDVGVDQGLFEGRLRLSATYFEIDTENLIQYVPTDYGSSTGCGVPGYICNINVAGVTERRGLELSGIALLNDWIALSAGYTYIDTETASGLRLARVPRHTFVVGIDVQPIDKLELNLTTQYVTDTVEIVAGAPVPLDDYFLVSAKAAYAVAPGWKAYVRGENLLDEDYETTRGFSTAGLSIYGGLQMSLPEN